MRLLSGISALCKNLVALIWDTLDPLEKFWKTRGCSRASEKIEKFVEKFDFFWQFQKWQIFASGGFSWLLAPSKSTLVSPSGRPTGAREREDSQNFPKMTRRAGVCSFSKSNSRAVVILAQTGAILFSGKNLLLLERKTDCFYQWDCFLVFRRCVRTSWLWFEIL